ncbi:glycoside hydrolase family 3 protein [Aplosporella prunicola CBS 121167]|uniref:beta-glucosidase n=1 Tax=Aplosporella prunicola CBS 121167 TaxID=1176127 RepID=A0A6A6AY37_9PEZI|nr:glycoside hydrolase family 3 protein [Aplosporella prunicola CBS 121167]KAF2136178.1 glycoside hydrolase family 3 protein [Aplosporella prunicola CBS 121167]
MISRAILAAFTTIVLAVNGQAPSNGTTGTSPLYKDPSASVDDRVADLLSRMTIQDKTAQLLQGDITNFINDTTNEFNYTGLVDNMEWGAGHIWTGYPIPQQWIAAAVKRAQDYLLENTTLGIPAIAQNEGIHGVPFFNATIFNSPIAHACSFNPELIEEMAETIAQESLALGINQIFAPVVDLARELRFGRVEETYGEDGYLAGELGYAFVKGLQGKNVSAMVKHFAGFSSPEQGLNTGPVHGGERELRTTWLPSFKRAIIDAGAWSIMSAYHSWDGVPAVADHHTLTDILRGEWGYEYYVMSDAGGTDRLCTAFKMCQSSPIDSDAVTMYALPAGNDIEMGGGSYNFKKIPDLVESGKLDISVVDEAVSRTLRTKFTMGLFENPYLAVPANETASLVHTSKSLALARKLDAESIVLLENKDSVLPLDKSASVAVIGPMADFMNYGDYVVEDSMYRGVTPFAGIKAASKGKVTYALGTERWSNDQSGFPEAVAAAKDADVAVVLVGTWSRDQTYLWQNYNATTGEHVDVSSLKLVGAQGALVKAIIDTGKPTVVVFQSGKPVTEPWISRNASALVQQFYPSEQNGNALADVLYGDHNPSGKLSVGIPYDVGTTPIFYDYLNSGRSLDIGMEYDNGTLQFGHQYVLNSPLPLYEFGYGKSYTTFAYSNVSLSSNTATASDTITATVSVTNNGTRDGQEVVQLYVADQIASVAVPNKELKGFKKVNIPAGETVDVSIDVKVENLGLWDLRMKYVVEPGDFTIFMGTSSADLTNNATLTVS